MPLSFASDIRPLFRDSPDVDSMKDYGLDFSSCEEVKARAAETYARLEDRSMPCDERWPEDRLELFKRWLADIPGIGDVLVNAYSRYYHWRDSLSRVEGLLLAQFDSGRFVLSLERQRIGGWERRYCLVLRWNLGR